MALLCKNADVSIDDWKDCLLKIDQDILRNNLYDESDKVIIILLPYKINDIKQSLTQFISDSFDNESMLFCCDVIMEFIVYNKYYIHNKINNNKKLKDNDPSKWTNDNYDELASTQSLILIDIETLKFVALPRNVNDLFNSWKISWNNGEKYGKICSQIFKNIGDKYLKNNFIFMDEDWANKTNFAGISRIGCIRYDGTIVEGDLLSQNSATFQISVHFPFHSYRNPSPYGQEYVELTVPNDRICAPP